MGFFSNLFGGKSKEERELDAVFEKINRILNSDELQMGVVPDMFRRMYNPTPMNRVPGAIGEFGRDPRNPIPCNGPLGEVTYLSRLIIPLKNNNFTRIAFHRLGSKKVNGRNVDQFEIISYDGYLYDVLYLDMYHCHKSNLCPKGYVFERECTGIRGTNQTNESFPYNQHEVAKKCAQSMIGAPVYDPQLTRAFNVDQADRVIGFARKLGPGAINWWDTEK